MDAGAADAAADGRGGGRDQEPPHCEYALAAAFPRWLWPMARSGFYYHARGIVRRPGGVKKPLYNILYGPPIFAPLLFAACGFLGLMASLLRREREK